MVPLPAVERTSPGHASLSFCRSHGKTVMASALAASPLRLLTPRNHGDSAWVYLSSLGGGLVDGDGIDVRVDVARGASAVLATQSTTKVYRSPRGCSQRIEGHIAEDASLALIPDAVVCFEGAKYAQEIALDLAPRASVLVLDGYTCGRSARGERWTFARYASRLTIIRGGAPIVIEAVRLD
ncbi:MAG: urease accessory protein UreD, partial [Polyangiaceae bacterium]